MKITKLKVKLQEAASDNSLSQKTIKEICEELKDGEGTEHYKAIPTDKYQRLLTFTQKAEAAKAAKMAASKGFRGSNVVKVIVISPSGDRKVRYVISSEAQINVKYGAWVLSKKGFQKLMSLK